jgi:hypothetical protein
MLADATQLPFADNSLGIVLASGLWPATPGHYSATGRRSLDIAREEYTIYPRLSPDETRRHNIRIGAIEEAVRVLEPGGLLVWQGSTAEDFDIAARVGLALRRSATYWTSSGPDQFVNYDAVFQKPAEQQAVASRLVCLLSRLRHQPRS